MFTKLANFLPANHAHQCPPPPLFPRKKEVFPFRPPLFPKPKPKAIPKPPPLRQAHPCMKHRSRQKNFLGEAQNQSLVCKQTGRHTRGSPKNLCKQRRKRKRALSSSSNLSCKEWREGRRSHTRNFHFHLPNLPPPSTPSPYILPLPRIFFAYQV